MNIILQFSRGSFKRFCLSADLPIAVLFQCVLSNNQTTIYIYITCLQLCLRIRHAGAGRKATQWTPVRLKLVILKNLKASEKGDTLVNRCK